LAIPALPATIAQQNRVKIFVCLAFDDEAAESNAIVGQEDRIVEVVGEALRHFRDGQARELAAESIDLGVQGIAAIAARGEQALRFGVDRLGAGPGFQPGETVSPEGARRSPYPGEGRMPKKAAKPITPKRRASRREPDPLVRPRGCW
jgi:hypothetical protein